MMYEQVRKEAGRSACPSVVIMDGQSVKTTERGGVRGFDAHKRIKGRKRHILVDTLGLPIAVRVEPANISDRRAASLLLGGLSPLFPGIRTVVADAGHESRKLAREIGRDAGWRLQIVKRCQRAFQGYRADLDCGAYSRLAWTQPPLEQRLRIQCPDIGDDDRHCSYSHHA